MRPLYFPFTIAGSYLASIGNVVGSRNAKKGVPVTQANAFGMGYGGLLTLMIHFIGGGSLAMDYIALLLFDYGPFSKRCRLVAIDLFNLNLGHVNP